jgi:hypothetical protein
MILKLLFLILPESTIIPCPARDGVNFSATSGERQENFSALIVEPATGCGTPGSYGKNHRNWRYGFLKIHAFSKTYRKPNHKI